MELIKAEQAEAKEKSETFHYNCAAAAHVRALSGHVHTHVQALDSLVISFRGCFSFDANFAYKKRIEMNKMKIKFQGLIVGLALCIFSTSQSKKLYRSSSFFVVNENLNIFLLINFW